MTSVFKKLATGVMFHVCIDKLANIFFSQIYNNNSTNEIYETLVSYFLLY